MDSISNLPLLEIAAEDDSLLFDVSAAASTTDVFSCSPLLPLRSNPPHSEGREGGATDSENRSLSVSDSLNKENADWNKPLKLSLELHQMKRKKKGGGYNLRKSLAWNRAFFTDEGVLNPTELSVISGSATANNLEAIHEEESVGTSIELQDIEENLFMHSSDAVPVEDRKIGATARFSPKPGASARASPAPVSSAKRKVLTVNDSVGNRSKRSACPPRMPVASSSLKKTDTVKAPSKELKVTRLPGPKSDVSASAATARSGMLTTGSSKKNQNARPATNLQKHAGIKGLSKNPKTVPTNPKVVPANKSSVTRTLTKQAEKHLGNSVSETHPPSRMHQSGTEAIKVPEASLPQGVSDIGEKKQQTQLQTEKLSGLRMPSPSLGYFSLAKAPSSHSQLQKSSKPCKPAKSNIPKLQNLETNSVNEARLPHAPGIRSEIVKGAAKNCTKELSLLDEKSEPSMQVDNKQMAGQEVEYNSMVSEKISKQEKVENVLQHVNIKSTKQGELHRSENASSMEDVVFPKHENKLLSRSHNQEKLEKEAEVLSNGYQSVFQETQSMHCQEMQRTSIMKGSISNTVHNAMGLDEDEQIKLLACDVHSSNEDLVLQAKHDSLKDSKLSGEFKEYNTVKTALLNSCLIDFNETVLGESIQEIPFKNTEQVNGDAADYVTSGGDAQVHLLKENLSVDCNETTESNLEAVNQQLQGGQLKTTSADIVGEISSSKENESHVNSGQLIDIITLSSKGYPQKSIPDINCPAESEPNIAEIEDCQIPVDDQSGFIQTRPVLEGCEKVIDSKAMHDSTQTFDLDSCSQDCMAVSAPACNTELRDEDSSRDASMHYDVPLDIPGNLEQQISKITYSKASEMLCEGENLVLDHHGHLLDQSEFSEVSENVVSNTKDSIGTEAEKSSGCVQHTPLVQLVQKVYHTNREIEESHVEDAQLQSFYENPAEYNCNSKHCFYVTNDRFPLADNNNMNDNSHLSDFQRAGAVVGVGYKNVNNIQQLDGDWLPTNIAFSEEINKTVEDAQMHSFNEITAANNCNSKHCLVTNDKFPLTDSNNINEDSRLSDSDGGVDSENVSDCLPTNIAFEGCDIHTSEHNPSNYHILPENKDGNIDVYEREVLLQMDDSKEGSPDILPLVEVQLNDNVISSECNFSIEVSKDSFTDVIAWKSEEHCSFSESSNFPASDNLTFNTDTPQKLNQNSPHGDWPETVSATACDIKVSNVSQESRSFHENDVENLQFAAQPSPMVKVDFDSRENDISTNNCCTISELQLRDGGSFRDASTHYDGQCDVPGNFEQQTSKITYSIANEMLCGDECLVPNLDHLVDQSDFSEVSADFISNNKGSIGSGAEKPSGHLQHILLSQLVQEFDYTDREIKESHLKDAQVQSFTENLMAYNCSSKYHLAVTDDKFPLADNNNINEDSLVSDFQRPGAVVGVDSQNVDNILIASSEEIKKEGALEGCDIHSSEHIASNHHIQAVPENKDGILVADERAELLQMDDAKKGSSDILPLVEVQLKDSQNVDNMLHLDGDWLPTIIATSGEIKKTNLSEDALEGCHIHSSEHYASNHHIQAMPENEDENLDVDERVELLQIDDVKKGSSDTLPLVEFQLKDSQNVDNILHLNGDWLPTVIATSEEIEKTNLSEDALEGCQIHSSEHYASNHHIQTMPENEDGNLDLDERVELLPMDDVKKGSSDILPFVELQLNDNVSSECDSSIKVSKHSFTDVVTTWKSEEHCSLSESSNLPALDNPTFNTRTPQLCEVSSLNGAIFSDEAETNNIFEKDESPNTNTQHQSKGNIYSAEDSSKTLNMEESATKSEVPTVKPPPNAAPFSDEWLAAIEAAGEGILTIKSGAVQNSPPDKPQHEPGPWSP